MTVNVRCVSWGSSADRAAAFESGSTCTSWPTALAFGHSVRAVDSDTTATERCGARSVDVNVRPCTIAMSSTSKYSGDTNLYAIAVFAPPDPANAARGAAIGPGHDAATATTEGSAVTACTIALRAGSLVIWTTTLSEIRMPES
jgi:hypothetical protein